MINLSTSKEELMEEIFKNADYETLKIKRDAIVQEIIVLKQKCSSYIAAAEETDKIIVLLSEQVRDAFLEGESADGLILKRLSQQQKALELRNTAKEINTTTIPSIQKRQAEHENEIADAVRAATEQCRTSFLKIIDEKMRAIDDLIMTWQMAVKAVDEETGTKDLFASFKWIILSDDGTRYVLLPKMKG